MTDQSDLAGHLDSLGAARVLVIGDVMLDRFIYGVVERISPEGPIPILRIEREVSMLGGAGNVLRNLEALGATTTFLAVVGDDPAGREVQDLVGEQTAYSHQLLVESGRPTTIKERYVAAGQQLLRTDREASRSLKPETATALVDAAQAALTGDASGAGALVLSDYGKGVLEPETIATLIKIAQAAKCPVIVDPKGRDYGIYRGADLITPNRRELHEATGLAVGSDDEVVATCRSLIAETAVKGVLATRSEEGMTLVQSKGEAQHFGAEAREVFDVSGAGDTVVSVLGAALAADIPVVEAARLANVVAGIVVGKVGTAVAQPSEILHALHATDLLAAEAKVADLDSLLGRIERWRRSGLKLGFTNGCFDLLHPGHVSLLQQARAACDRLIVGLNSDASVKRLKGEGRPIQPEAARAAVLASLASVDQVVVFGEDTPLKLIEAIRPEVLIKGADYTVNQVVGADIVEGYGGRVVLAELAPGHSTTETIRRLNG